MEIELDGVTRTQRDWQLSHACDWAGMCVLVDLAAAALYHNKIREGRIVAPAAFCKFWPHCWATRKDMSITLLVNNEGIKYLFRSDLLSYAMFSTWSGCDSAVSEQTGWDRKIPLSCWIQEWIPVISYHPVTCHPSNTVSLTKKEKPLFSNSTLHKKWSGST